MPWIEANYSDSEVGFTGWKTVDLRPAGVDDANIEANKINVGDLRFSKSTGELHVYTEDCE